MTTKSDDLRLNTRERMGLARGKCAEACWGKILHQSLSHFCTSYEQGK